MARRQTQKLRFSYPRCTALHSSALLFFSLSALVTCGVGCREPSTSPNRPKVSIGIQVSPAMTLLMVAKEKGFFEEQGVDVELKQFTAGKFALQAFFAGAVDYAVSGEVPVCLAALGGNPSRTVTQVVAKTADEVRIVARKNGPTDPAGYFKSRKRRIATSFGGGPEFFTYNFLQHYKIEPNEVEILSQRPEDMPAALTSKSVDAISIFDPFAFIAEKQLGADALTFRASELYSELYILVAHPKAKKDDDVVVSSMLRALQEAEDYTAAHPEEAKQILQKYTKLDLATINGIWGSFSFQLSLTADLLADWNAEARWAKATGKVTPQTAVPNFNEYVDPRMLQAINNSAVRLQ